jgi:hypothetical protein
MTPTRRRRFQTPALRACDPEGVRGYWRRPRRYDTTTIRRLRRPTVGNTWAGWGSIPIVFFPGMAGHPCPLVPPYVRRPFPSKENRQISERDEIGPPVVPRGQEIGLGSRNLRSRAQVQGGGTSGGPHGQTESGGRVLAVNTGARAPRGGVTRQGVVLIDLQPLCDCQ